MKLKIIIAFFREIEIFFEIKTNLSLPWDHSGYYSTRFLLVVSHAQPKHGFFQWQFEIVHVPEIMK